MKTINSGDARRYIVISISGDVEAKGNPARCQLAGPRMIAWSSIICAILMCGSGTGQTVIWSGGIPEPQSGGGGFGSSVAAQQGELFVGAESADGLGPGTLTGACYRYIIKNGTYEYVEKCVPGDLSSIDTFGSAISLDQDWLVVTDRSANAFSGKAYVYHRQAGMWSQSQVLLPTSPAGTIAWYGKSVALRGNHMMIGAPYDQTGFVYIYDLQGSTWSLTHKLYSPNPSFQLGSSFGSSVACGPQGDLVVGAPDWFNTSSMTFVGAVHIYQFEQGQWKLTQSLVNDNGQGGELFGEAVACGDDVLVVGNPNMSNLAYGGGAAFVYARTSPQSQSPWSLIATVQPPNPQFMEFFGNSCSIDGDRIWVGNRLCGTGAIREYRLIGGVVQQAAEYTSSMTCFGRVLSVDQNILVASNVTVPGFSVAFLVDDKAPVLLTSDYHQISLAAGGVAEMMGTLFQPLVGAPYLVLGSITGTAPGIPIGSYLLPIVVDAYTNLILVGGMSAWSNGFVGSVPSSLHWRAKLAVPPSPGLAGLAGLVLHHCFVVLDPVAGLLLPSNTTSVTLIP